MENPLHCNGDTSPSFEHHCQHSVWMCLSQPLPMPFLSSPYMCTNDFIKTCTSKHHNTNFVYATYIKG
jgi:hypothetical protein